MVATPVEPTPPVPEEVVDEVAEAPNAKSIDWD
jgi:hypothetical protein